MCQTRCICTISLGQQMYWNPLVKCKLPCGSRYPTLSSLGRGPVKSAGTIAIFTRPMRLRFDLNKPEESRKDFEKRINSAARDEDEVLDTKGGSERWKIGARGRNLGSVHSDIWEGTAADLAACNLIGIYPVIGWWRERHQIGKYNRKARYSLIVSLETKETDVDIYTPVYNEVGITVPVEGR